MEYLKIQNRKELNTLTVAEIDGLITRLKAPRSMTIQRTMEPKSEKVNCLIRFYRKQFDAGKVFIEVKEKVKK